MVRVIRVAPIHAEVAYCRINDSDLMPAILTPLEATMVVATAATAELRLLVDVVPVRLHVVIVVIAAALGSSREVARVIVVADRLLLLLNWRGTRRIMLLLVMVMTRSICAMVAMATTALIRRGVLPVSSF